MENLIFVRKNKNKIKNMRSFFLIALFCSFCSCSGFYRTYSYKTPSGVKLKGFIFKGNKIPAQLCFTPFKKVKYSLLLGTEKKNYKVPYLRFYEIEVVDTIPFLTIYSNGKIKITSFGLSRDGEDDFRSRIALYFIENRLHMLAYLPIISYFMFYEADSSNNPRTILDFSY
jgi:hypothetical protein